MPPRWSASVFLRGQSSCLQTLGVPGLHTAQLSLRTHRLIRALQQHMCPLTDTRKKLQNIPTSPQIYMAIPKIYTEHEGTNYTSSTVHRKVLLEVQELVGTCFAQSFCGISLTPAECLRHWDNMWNIRETVSSKIIGSVSVLRYAFICSPSERYYLSITAIFISAWHKK